jgi:hypothetical protein
LPISPGGGYLSTNRRRREKMTEKFKISGQ